MNTLMVMKLSKTRLGRRGRVESLSHRKGRAARHMRPPMLEVGGKEEVEEEVEVVVVVVVETNNSSTCDRRARGALSLWAFCGLQEGGDQARRSGHCRTREVARKRTLNWW
jgi:hypothetical protein